MESLYAIIGDDIYLVENEVESIILKLKVDPFNVLTYDLDEQELQDFLQEITTISLLSDKKVIKVKNAWFFNEKKDIDLSQLITYFKNPKTDTTVIFMLTNEIDDSLEISKEAKKYVRIERLESIDKKDLPDYVKTTLEKYKYSITSQAVEELLERVKYDFHSLSNEIEKLKLFAFDSRTITIEDIKLLVARNVDDNLFELSSAVISKNKKKALEIYYDLIMKNIDPVAIIGNLSSKIKETMTTKHLLKYGYSQQSIADYFSVGLGRAYYMIKNANGQTLKVLERYFDSLANLDYLIKSGQTEKKLGLELWLLEGLGAEKQI